MFSCRNLRCITWIVTCIVSAKASAQTGPELLLKPWPKGQRVQTEGDFTLLSSGSTGRSDDFGITFYDMSGRLRLLPEQRADPRMGWNYTQINTSGDPGLPSQLIDTSMAFGMGVADWSGWLAGVTLGVGYAGAGAFDDSNAWYGMADFAVGRELGKDSSFGFVIDYDGNRTFLPDVPIPGFLYTRRIERTLLLSVGFPFSSIEWKPNDKVTIAAKYTAREDLEAKIDYGLSNNLGVFLQANVRRNAFHWDQLKNSRDRLLYESKRIELGARWTPIESASLILAGGYMFGQEFNVGFDTRDQERLAAPSDEPYVRVGFEVRF